MRKSNPVLMICLFLCGCTYGYDIITRTTPITTKAFPPANSNPIELYYEDNNIKITRPYEQLAMIEIQGTESSSPSELLQEMRKKAAEIGADAVINITQHYIVRDRGEIASEVLDKDKNKPEKYDTISLTGIAIKYQ